MVNVNPARAARLSASLNKAFGEVFTISPMMATADPNGRPIADTSRIAYDLPGNWTGPSTTKTPATRGAVTDDVAHNWSATFPSANFEDAAFVWMPRKGDTLTRKLDNSIHQIERILPNSFGRSTLMLTKRKSS